MDWPLDSISEAKAKEYAHRTPPTFDPSAEEIIKLLGMTDYNMFRKHMKSRSEEIVKRAASKYTDMEYINEFNKHSHEAVTYEQLCEMFRVKPDESTIFTETMKPNALKMFNTIIKKQMISNPAEVEVAESLYCIKMREEKIQLLNILNGMRCYQRNICFDMRVINNHEFSFQLDDQFLIDSNKQTVESF